MASCCSARSRRLSRINTRKATRAANANVAKGAQPKKGTAKKGTAVKGKPCKC